MEVRGMKGAFPNLRSKSPNGRDAGLSFLGGNTLTPCNLLDLHIQGGTKRGIHLQMIHMNGRLILQI